jgi:hypothetical protein
MLRPRSLADARWLGEDAGRSRLRDLTVMEEPQPEITEQARWLWETTRGEAKNDNEAFGMLLAQIIVELRSVQAMMSASVSRLRS